MPNPEVSVAMCTYQGEQFLLEQLETVANQSRPPDELVVCDDGSTDRTLEILRDFQSSADFEVILKMNSERLGILKNFQKATALCRGEIIFFADQDDVWHLNKLEKLMEALAASPGAGLVFSNVELVDDRLNSVGYDLWQFRRLSRARQKRLMNGHGFDYILGQGIAAGMALGFRTGFKDLILPFDGLGHDLWTSVLIAAVADIAVVNESLGKWRQHRTQETGAITIRSLGRQIAEARVHNADHYGELARGYVLLLERLSEMSEKFPSKPEAMTAIEHKISHLEARAAMRKGKGKGALMKTELLCGNYWKHSYGLRSVAKDLLF